MLAAAALIFVVGALSGPGQAAPSTDPKIRFLEARVESDPWDYLTPTRLGKLYLGEARRSGELKFYFQAEEVFKIALDRKPDHYAAMLALASAYTAEHRFQEALAIARKAAAMNPGDAEGYGILGDACFEVGDVKGAGELYAKLPGLLPGLFSATRLAKLQHLNGDTPGAITRLAKAVQETEGAYATPEDLAWCHVQIGQLFFGGGDWENAEKQYGLALETLPESFSALEHLAELRAAQRKYAEAILLYEKVTARVPRPEFFQAFGDFCAALGKPAEAKEWRGRALEEYLKAAREGKACYYHHLAGFCCDSEPDPAAALRWARKDLEGRETVYAYDALAWALYQAGEYAEAVAAMKKALRLGTKDAHMLYHASQIFYRAGDLPQAREYLRQTEAANPKYKEFHVHR